MDDLLTSQGTTGGLISRFLTNLGKVGKDKLSATLLETRLSLLESYWESFWKTHIDLQRFSELKLNTYCTEDFFTQMEEEYLNAKTQITIRINNLRAARPAPQAAPAGQPGPLPSLNLPKLSLPRFSGDALEWETFRDLFNSMVHDVSSIPNVLKLQYLKTSLAGEAAQLIKGISVNDANYEGAWQLLVKRYDNIRVLLATHLNQVLSCPPVQQESASELKRLIDTSDESRRAMTALKRPVSHWDDWFVHLLVHKLDTVTRKDWETSLANVKEVPTYANLSTFIENRIQALEATQHGAMVSKSLSQLKTGSTKPKPSFPSSHMAVTSPTKPKPNLVCSICNGSHFTGYCFKFNRKQPSQRWELVQQYRLCANCLRGSHQLHTCPSEKRCFKCSGKHHTMLHSDSKSVEEITDRIPSSVGDTSHQPDRVQQDQMSSCHATAEAGCSPTASTYTQQLPSTNRSVLLATALVRLRSASGNTLLARALLDQGSDTSFVTEHIAQKLRLPRTPVQIPITGLGGVAAGTARSAVALTMQSHRNGDLNIPLHALVLPALTKFIPSDKVQTRDWPHLMGLELADPTYEESARVDLLIGADIYGLILQPGLRVGPVGTPIAQKTSLGWIISGLAGQGPREGFLTDRRPTCLHSLTQDTVCDLLQRFWALDQFPDSPVPSAEDVECENHFASTHSRTKDGRYMVRLPCKSSEQVPLTDSRRIAVSRLARIESQFRKDPQLAHKYNDFMREYLDLGHMTVVDQHQRPHDDQQPYYMPHRAVVKPHDPTHKLRVVFNASQKTATGFSLNDRLKTGPKLQSDLWAILTSWRRFKVAFTTDIVKMYRQILVHPLDQHLQRIVWRANPDVEPVDYELTTVTYGTASAPFLAIRVLRQLALEEASRFPQAGQVLLTQSYVDDLFAGADSGEGAHQLQQELIALLNTAGFSLSKWASNSSTLIGGDSSRPMPQDGPLDPCVNTLGLRWDPRRDVFLFKVHPPAQNTALTKRQLLSEIARLFDPMGWLSPVLISAKIMLQDLWIAGTDWDSPVELQHSTSWESFRAALADLELIEVPRWIHTTSMGTCELHGFADASDRAYAACIYLCTTTIDGTHRSALIFAKAKVAPVKTCSIPRLELCAALLLSTLLPRVVDHLKLQAAKLHVWSDSTVVLAWLKNHASRWKRDVFVANRVAAVQTNLPSATWRYVPSASNPADKATRGISPCELRDCQLWWQGPDWLSDPDRWPAAPLSTPELPITDANTSAQVHFSHTSWLDDLVRRYSCYFRLVRVVAYCFRFADNLRKPQQSREFANLTTPEIARGFHVLLANVQATHFAQECEDLARGRMLSRRSSLRSLNPFLDSEGLLRVGGRLNNAFLTYDEKHPIILPKNDHLVSLIVCQAHKTTLHGGPQLTLSHLLRRFWVIGGRSLVRSITRACVRCARFRARPQAQLMGQLPTERVTAERPFLHAGVDYAGPILVRTAKGRGHKSHKGYICLFVCLATRAVHLEVVSDYSSVAFLAAFDRFSSRRGRPAIIFSDNGTTFTGADRQLQGLFNAACSQHHDVAEALANLNTKWTFIPPHAPHFGGLWEAGVKAAKHHLRRVIGDATLTFEELSTLLAKIEACLNSRPLHPLSTDPSDLSALTPGHFLIGSALTAVPEPTLLDLNQHRLSRWQLLSQMRDHFWYRWSKEYLHHLQERTKWQQPRTNLKVDDLVLVKNDILPPTQWQLARVIELHPGPDNLVRVVTIRTATSTLKRPISKLCLLPIPT